jgi:catechol 2,3-dioxygenase-like lactoylglutathione lyase family enzyme
MRTSQMLHYAFRAKDPERLALFYAELFESPVLLHPVLTGMGIMLVKLNHPEALFHGLLEFWPWDVVWDSQAAVFRHVEPKPSPMSYGHLALKVHATTDEITAELTRRGVPYRIEPREPQLGLYIVTIDDPEGNMIELFPDIDHVALPPEALCPVERAPQAIAEVRRRFRERTAHLDPAEGYSLTVLQGP